MSAEDRELTHDDALEEADQSPPDPAELGIVLPDDPQEAIALLLTELRDARAEATSYLDDLKRVAADFDNYRKRALREQQAIIERASERVVRELLPVLDSFDAALAIEPQTETEEKLLAGMRSTYNQLMEILRKEGVEVIPTWDEPFDPEVHEAVTSPPEGSGRLMVGRELRRGYRLKGKVIRPALVEPVYEDQAASSA
jgi:molecular chaperone GrpE